MTRSDRLLHSCGVERLAAYLSLLLVAAPSLATAGEVAPLTRFAVDALGDLGCPGAGVDEARAVNRDGWIVGAAANVACRSRAFLFDPESGTMRDLGVLPGAEWSWANGINDAGIVVGRSGDRGFVWDAHHGMRPLEPARTGSFAESEAVAINHFGWVAGNTAVPYGVLPCLWNTGRSDPAPEVIDALPIGASYGVATGIADDGTVVGRVGGNGLDAGSRFALEHAALWRRVGRRFEFLDLGPIEGQSGAALAVNNVGQIVGVAGSGASAGGWLLEDGVLTDLGSPGGGAVRPLGLNDDGVAVGVESVDRGAAIPHGGGSGHRQHGAEAGRVGGGSGEPADTAFWWNRVDGLVALPSLSGAGGADRARAVNGSVTIVGSSIDDAGHRVAVRWMPLAEGDLAVDRASPLRDVGALRSGIDLDGGAPRSEH